MKTLQISIPKPCHEDWNRMSQREQERFCDKCCKTVTDFSGNSPEEIRQILFEKKNKKLCGRFTKDQLARPVRLNIAFQTPGIHFSALEVFFVALLFAFGTTLFSCTTYKNETVGEISISGIEPPASSADSQIAVTLTGVLLTQAPEPPTQGEPCIAFTELPLIQPETGDQENFTDTTIDLPEVQVTEENINPFSMRLVGAVAFTVVETQNADPLFETDSIAATGNKDLLEEAVARESMEIYPNPAMGMTMLRLNLTEEKNVQAGIFDMAGRLRQTFVESRQVPGGENEFQFDLSGLPPGSYLVRVVIGEEVMTKRVIKQ